MRPRVHGTSTIWNAGLRELKSPSPGPQTNFVRNANRLEGPIHESMRDVACHPYYVAPGIIARSLSSARGNYYLTYIRPYQLQSINTRRKRSPVTTVRAYVFHERRNPNAFELCESAAKTRLHRTYRQPFIEITRSSTGFLRRPRQKILRSFEISRKMYSGWSRTFSKDASDMRFASPQFGKRACPTTHFPFSEHTRSAHEARKNYASCDDVPILTLRAHY